ncbi:phytanoyl-CoA dioxygenase family protein [Variovorax sp. LjRoot175]
MNFHAPASKPEDIHHLDELKRDLARTHRTTRTNYEGVQVELIDADYARLIRDGYVIIESLLAPDQLQQIRAAADECLGPTSRNSFEGKLTQRVYDVFSKTRAVDALAEHPRVLGLLDRIFLPNYLLSQAQIINIMPGSEPQLLHHDDGAYPFRVRARRSGQPRSGPLTTSPRRMVLQWSFLAAIPGTIIESRRLMSSSLALCRPVPLWCSLVLCGMEEGAIFLLGRAWL